MSEDKKEYTAKEVAKAILEKAKELTKEALESLEKAEKTKHDRCVEQVEEKSPDVKNPHAVCVAAGVKPSSQKKGEMEKASPENQTSAQMAEVKVPQPKAPTAQPKAIAKQPLQLKKFMEKCEMKKAKKYDGKEAADRAIKGAKTPDHPVSGFDQPKKTVQDFIKEKEQQKKIAKKERCWEGYEPTPGKEPYTEGSCRKK